MKKRNHIFLLCMGLALVGCNTLLVKKGVSLDDEAKAKLFTADASMARVYVFRNASFLGKNLVAKFIVNKKVVAENDSNQFTVISMAAGSYELECISGKNSDVLVSLIHNRKRPPLQLSLDPGKIYFVQQVFKGKDGFSIEVKPQQEAEPVIKKGKLATTVTF